MTGGSREEPVTAASARPKGSPEIIHPLMCDTAQKELLSFFNLSGSPAFEDLSSSFSQNLFATGQ